MSLAKGKATLEQLVEWFLSELVYAALKYLLLSEMSGERARLYSHRGLFTIADQSIPQSIPERAEPGLVVSPLEETLAENRLTDLF